MSTEAAHPCRAIGMAGVIQAMGLPSLHLCLQVL